MVGGPLPLLEEVSVTRDRGEPQLLPHISTAWTFHMFILLLLLRIQNVGLLDGVHKALYSSRTAGWHLLYSQSPENKAGGSCGDILWTVWFDLMAMDFGVAVGHTRPHSAAGLTLHFQLTRSKAKYCIPPRKFDDDHHPLHATKLRLRPLCNRRAVLHGTRQRIRFISCPDMNIASSS